MFEHSRIGTPSTHTPSSTIEANQQSTPNISSLEDTTKLQRRLDIVVDVR
jgi:hypothetical protein